MRKAFFALVIVCFLSSQGALAEIEISVATDKAVYQLDEDVVISVTAYNPTDEAITLVFGSDLQASYWMDGIYDWEDGRSRLTMLTYVTIDPYQFNTWQLTHGDYERSIYPLGLGAHSVVGEVLEYGLSNPAGFQVVPEPSCVMLLVVGPVLSRFRKLRKR